MNKKINKPPIFWQKAKKTLSAKDKKLSKIIESYPSDFLFSKSDPFFTLARSIVGQQISVKAAQSVWNKLEIKINNVSPQIISKTHSSTLKSVGLSRQKVNT
jgi:DNA-3-methyladenine glycosylase II